MALEQHSDEDRVTRGLAAVDRPPVHPRRPPRGHRRAGRGAAPVALDEARPCDGRTAPGRGVYGEPTRFAK